MKAKEKEKVTGSFEDYLLNELKDRELASEYINAAIEDGDVSVFLMALGDVVKAQGMSKVTKRAGVNRENAYRAVSKEGNPTIKNVSALLDAVGLRFVTEPRRETSGTPPAKHLRRSKRTPVRAVKERII